MNDLIFNYVSRETIPLFREYISLIKQWNRKTALVQKDSIENIWERHILDSLQLIPYLPNIEHSILDIGSGGGFPGIVLAIAGYTNLTLCDSNTRKTVFLSEVVRTLGLKVTIINDRVENLKGHYDVITSRACAHLNILFNFMDSVSRETNSYGVFLKGKLIAREIDEAKQHWLFEYKLHQSITSPDGRIAIVKNLTSKEKGVK